MALLLQQLLTVTALQRLAGLGRGLVGSDTRGLGLHSTNTDTHCVFIAYRLEQASAGPGLDRLHTREVRNVEEEDEDEKEGKKAKIGLTTRVAKVEQENTELRLKTSELVKNSGWLQQRLEILENLLY